MSRDNAAAGIPPIKQRVLSYDLGIKAVDKNGHVINDIVIPKNRPIPVTAKKTYYTHREDQEKMSLTVIQNHHDSNEIIELGTVHFGPFPKPRKNYPLEVGFEVSAQGTVKIRAMDLETKMVLEESMIDEKTASELLLSEQKNLVSLIKVNK
jgi:molecular chaperone DnaK